MSEKEAHAFSKNIKVTIGVVVRNCGRQIEQIVELINNQNFPRENMEVIFVDDGSDDDTLSEISSNALKLDVRHRIFHHNWKGLGFSRNVALSKAQGDYIIWLDDGTLIASDYIKKHVDFMEQNSNVGIVRGNIGIYSGLNRVAILENMIQLAFSYKFAKGFTTKLPGAAASLYRVNAANEVGGFNQHIQGAGEDTDIASRMLSAGWKIYLTHIHFFIDYKTEITEVWKKSYWYGYGAHFILHKHKELRDLLVKSTPAVGFIEGLLASFPAYKLTGKKIAFLLPIFLSVKRLIWFRGFLQGHLDSYGHADKTN